MQLELIAQRFTGRLATRGGLPQALAVAGLVLALGSCPAAAQTPAKGDSAGTPQTIVIPGYDVVMPSYLGVFNSEEISDLVQFIRELGAAGEAQP